MKVDSSSNPSVMLIWIQHQVSVYVQTLNQMFCDFPPRIMTAIMGIIEY